MKLYDMVNISSFDELKILIRRSFRKRETTSGLIGIMFAPPTTFIKSEISDSFEYFHYRSEEIIDFFWAGYETSDRETSKKLWELNQVYWEFNPRKFNEIREGFENETNWTFSGESDFILFRANMDEFELIEFDFTDAIVINLEKAKTENAISSVRELFEIIFRISEKLTLENSSLSLSKQLIIHSGKKSAFSLLVSFLPKRFQKDINTIYTFCTENIEKIS